LIPKTIDPLSSQLLETWNTQTWEFFGVFGVWKSDKMSPKGEELMSKRSQGFSFFHFGWTQFYECFVVESGSEQYVLLYTQEHPRGKYNIAPIALPIASWVQVDTSSTSDEGRKEVHHSFVLNLMTKIQRKIHRYWINMIKLTTNHHVVWSSLVLASKLTRIRGE
jgi:hypothetical protein